jgi:hypothetical protein
MRSFGDGLLCDDFAPSRRDVVKYGAATAISAAVIPVHRVLAAENANTVSGTVYESRSSSVRRQMSDPGIAGVYASVTSRNHVSA